MHSWLRVALAAQVLAWSIGHAETVPEAPKDPADPKAPVPETKYRSAFDSYRPYEDTKLRSWREANDEARALGGHMGQVRGGAQVPRDAGSGAAQEAKPARGER
ncbi:MAG: hypothetical protein R3357_15245 [Burkholderiales bacterium]|nr:hypothetical protein [Burkholderiales bacterium]